MHDSDYIEHLAKQIKNPTTVVIGKKRYQALCVDYTPTSPDEVFETIELDKIATSSGELLIQITNVDNTLAVR